MLNQRTFSRRRVLVFGSALATSALLAACGQAKDSGNGGRGGSPSTTPSPEPDPTPTTAEPGIEYPAEEDAAVVRIAYEGGFIPPEEHIRRLPIVSLQGNGDLIMPGPMIEIFPPPALPNLLVTTLTSEGIQEILKKADEAGLLDGDRDFTGEMGVADAPTTVFTVTAGGQTSTTRVYALGMEDGTGAMADDEQEARQKLTTFLADITGAPTWLPESAIAEAEREYEFKRLQLVVYPYDTSIDFEVAPSEQEWPLDTPPAEIGLPFNYPADGARCATLEGAELEAMLTGLREANTLTRWMHAEEPFFVINRPLLPGEEGCHAEVGNPGTGSGSAPIEHPTAADQAIIRYEVTGGFVPMEFHATAMPSAALYGDGLMVTQGPQILIYPPPALPALEFSQLSEHAIQLVLTEAKDAGLLEGDQTWDELSNFVADAGTGTLSITAGGTTSVIRVYAPGTTGIDDIVSPEEIAFREKFDAFISKLQSVTTWLPPEDFVLHIESPLTRLQLISQPAGIAPVSDPTIEPGRIEWPLENPLTELGEPAFLEESRCFVLEGEDYTTVMALLLNATTITRWDSAGESFILYPRPLLPDEEGCVDPFSE